VKTEIKTEQSDTEVRKKEREKRENERMTKKEGKLSQSCPMVLF
jgi:hypothetical protein